MPISSFSRFQPLFACGRGCGGGLITTLQHFALGAWRARQNLAEMFSREEILRSAVFAAIGGIITLVVLKFLKKNEGTGARREIRGANNLNEAKKQPEEHDERF